MYITPITNYSFTSNTIRILAQENKMREYLYLDILNLTRTEKFGASFHTNFIDIPSPTKNVIDKLKSLNIKFGPVKK